LPIIFFEGSTDETAGMSFSKGDTAGIVRHEALQGFNPFRYILPGR
jgi:hypothetical protein